MHLPWRQVLPAAAALPIARRNRQRSLLAAAGGDKDGGTWALMCCPGEALAAAARSFLNLSSSTQQATPPPLPPDATAMAIDQYTLDKKQTILHINASITPDSVTARVATAMVSHLTHHYHRHCVQGHKLERPEDVLAVEELDVWSDKLPKFDRDTMQRVWRARNNSQDEADIAAFKPIQELAQQLVRADFLVVTCPVWNFSIPYVLKQYIDCIVQPGLTFRNADAEGPSRPFFTGKPVIIISSSGGKPPPAGEDFVYPFISKIFAMCGFDEPHHVAIEGLANHDKQICYENAVHEANEIADSVVRSHKLRLEANTECETHM